MRAFQSPPHVAAVLVGVRDVWVGGRLRPSQELGLRQTRVGPCLSALSGRARGTRLSRGDQDEGQFLVL